MKRELFDKLTQWKTAATRKPLLLYGARQIGKTYLLKEFGQKSFERCHYFNFEEDRSLHTPFKQHLTPQRIIEDFKILGYNINLERDLIIFDEVQTCPEALTSLKYFAEQADQSYICAAGSLLGLYMHDGSFPVGKVELCHMVPLTFKEFIDEARHGLSEALQEGILKKQKLSEALHLSLLEYFKQYLYTGGMPEAVVSFFRNPVSGESAPERVRTIQKNLIINYQADIAKHCGKINAMHIERLWSHIPMQLASTQDSHAAKFKFKDVIPNIKGFDRLAGPMDWLIKAKLVLKTPIINRVEQPLMAFAKENIFKLFMFDVGILNAFTSLERSLIQSFDFGTYKGYLAENFVAQELHALDIPLLSWQEGTAQIEFIASDQGRVIPIEVKSGRNTRAKSLLSFKKKYAPSLAIKLSLLPFTGRTEDATLNVPIYAAHLLPQIMRAY